jgi:hypothetical protein
VQAQRMIDELAVLCGVSNVVLNLGTTAADPMAPLPARTAAPPRSAARPSAVRAPRSTRRGAGARGVPRAKKRNVRRRGLLGSVAPHREVGLR